jgi:adenylate cyclase
MMAKEIERKYLVKSEVWRNLAEKKTLYRQGYLCREKDCTVRVRIAGGRGFLTVKGLTVGATRSEYEYEIPMTDAGEMLEALAEKPLIEKMRSVINIDGTIWEVDEFLGENKGLIVAEVELRDEVQKFQKPDWIGDEVTADPKYYNANLVKNPYSKWK